MSTLNNKKSRQKSTDNKNTALTGMTEKERLLIKKTAEIIKNPVLWAKAFLRTVDNASKKVVPWTARWYQAEMLLSDAVKIVARCGRRTGEYILPFLDKLSGSLCFILFHYIICIDNQQRIITGSPLMSVQRLDARFYSKCGRILNC